MPVKLFLVILLMELSLVGTTLAEDFQVGEYRAYVILGEAKLVDDAEYISFTGDFGFRKRIPPSDALEYHLSNESDLLSNFQLSIINLEFMLNGMSGQELDIQTDNIMISILKKSGYDVIALANNHVMDYGKEGVQYNSLKLKEAGLNMIGTRDYPVHHWVTGDQQIAIIALTDYIDEPDRNQLILEIDKTDQSLLNELSHKSHFQIAFVHLGSMSSFVSPHEHKQVKRLLEAGIDLVVCTGSHFIKGILINDGKPVAYGIGNHLFSYLGDDTESIGMHLVAGFISGELTQLFVIPFYNSIWEGKTGPLDKSDFELFKKKLIDRSSQDTNLYFSDPRNLDKIREQFSRFRLDSLKKIKLRHFKYAAGIVIYNYPIITAAGCTFIVIALGLFVFRIHSIRRKQNK